MSVVDSLARFGVGSTDASGVSLRGSMHFCTNVTLDS